MKSTTVKIYALNIFVIVLCLFALLSVDRFFNIPVAFFLVLMAVLTRLFLGKGKRIKVKDSRNRNQVFWTMLLLGIFYIVLEFTSGLLFGFYRSALFMASGVNLYGYLLPAIPIVLATEYMRHIFLSQRVKHIRLVIIMAMALSDMVIIRCVISSASLDGNLVGFGYVLLPAITACLLYNFVSDHFGIMPCLPFRLIMAVYLFILPIRPATYQYFLSFIKTVYPVFTLWFIRHFFTEEEDRERRPEKNAVIKYAKTVLAVLYVVILIGIVSNRGLIGVFVIGSESMTGTINKGDGVIFERYRGQGLHKGQIIAYDVNQGEYQNIHRIVETKEYGGETVYITKGDANRSADDGYVSDKEIVGIVRMRVPGLGWPTLWINSIFEKE